MGNREALLAGAKRCLYEKGYGRTTARDIATASGVSLAAIGYHFGSKDALMNTALMDAIGEWGDALGAALADAAYVHATPEERFVASWDRVLETFVEHRGLWVAQFEMMTLLDQAPELREALSGVQKMARLSLAALFQGKDEVPDNETELSRGIFYQAMLAGLAAQWLVAPEQVPSGRDLFRGLQTVSASVLGGA
ncbi:AcrR family transcriptional regulator [Kitasatospora sp. MAA4]|uniref:TetR/AcrR family transcriptional regulator n=1 Tax=Kitasatospora sp. MAA4 TaxID=3035093 RepID=UPI002476FDA4|nr:helix-turn-helix domain-containing protein [Kitasatospora sp. MAA4]MDH6135415.1 AcrR family transcriptional regulator [Kitasatospora sp. MAA4]